MPKLVRLYILSIAIGFALAAVFVGLLTALDVAGLQHLMGTTRGGWIAVLMLVFFHGILFSGVQFAIRIMLMAEDDDPKGGLRQRDPPCSGAGPCQQPRAQGLNPAQGAIFHHYEIIAPRLWATQGPSRFHRYCGAVGWREPQRPWQR